MKVSKVMPKVVELALYTHSDGTEEVVKVLAAAPWVRREDLAAHKRPQRARHGHGAALWRLFEGRRLRWRCVVTRGSTSSALVRWFIVTGF